MLELGSTPVPAGAASTSSFAFRAIDASETDFIEFRRAPVAADALRGRDLIPGRFEARVTVATVRQVATSACESLGIVVDEVADDIAKLLSHFLTAFERDAVRLRLEIVDDTSCPKLHIDVVHVRMITTYLGDGTEYADVACPDIIRQVETGAVALFKGRTHPTHAGIVLHRSPTTTADAPRIVLIVD